MTPSLHAKSRSSSFHSRHSSRKSSALHAYSKGNAPHPFSYNREVMELFVHTSNILDHALVYRTKSGCTFTEYKENTPKRCLDPECGVGFDLVDIQFNLECVEPSVAMLRLVFSRSFNQLLFEDNEFDYVHLFTIVFAVPKDKEISRILKPGRHVEQIEVDARFPTLPRWLTRPLHNASRMKYYEVPMDLSHDHALLEQLFYSAFESQFINPNVALSCLATSPQYLNVPFHRQFCISPPLAPLLSFPRETIFPSRAAVPPTMHLDTGQPSQNLTVSPSPLSASTTLVHLSFCAQTSEATSVSSPSRLLPSAHSVEKVNILPALAKVGETVHISGEAAYELFGMEALAGLDEHTLFLHLQHAVGFEGEYTGGGRGGGASREWFDAMFKGYKVDVHARVALWRPMLQYGWTYPRQGPMTETKMANQEQLRRSILEPGC
ncbi:uncharacterized protein PHACADRAFT_156745 [Phanerochaete carnosa HHB-10118-sp]|uniref:Uncharacterized protein n=1 Tax=Phanerochaete carnosa (strain HHB-10118-sp) TaxID=650164 RepID=K5XEJ1_PHACS|nr:uncharacterized protein PHACADRAFT_156745 [Phanerochaete carnosa HHB-10118-sp]EKM61487.1 hypothetical protein PHACADRAFT_156745 [Phanerochaete carnosa HHB-10118-sp]